MDADRWEEYSPRHRTVKRHGFKDNLRGGTLDTPVEITLLNNVILEAIRAVRAHIEAEVTYRCDSWDWIFSDQPGLKRKLTFSEVCSFLELDISYMRESLRKQFSSHAKTLDEAPSLEDLHRLKRQQRSMDRAAAASIYRRMAVER